MAAQPQRQQCLEAAKNWLQQAHLRSAAAPQTTCSQLPIPTLDASRGDNVPAEARLQRDTVAWTTWAGVAETRGEARRMEETATERKARLKALRAAAEDAGALPAPSGDECVSQTACCRAQLAETDTQRSLLRPPLKFRNYVPRDEELRAAKVSRLPSQGCLCFASHGQLHPSG